MNRRPLLVISILLASIAMGLLFVGLTIFFTPVDRHSPPESATINTAWILGGIVCTGLFSFFLWIFALVHMLTNRALQGTDKIVWAIVIVFLNVLGAILYFVVSPFVRSSSPRQINMG